MPHHSLLLANFGEEFDSVKRKMILVGELATLGMELQIDAAGLFSFVGKPDRSVDSTNLQTIQTALANLSGEVETVQKGQPGSNAADAASAFVNKWQQSSAGNSSQQSNANYPAGSPLRSLGSEQTREEVALTASDELKLTELLHQWEGGEDRLDRKKVRSRSHECSNMRITPHF